MRVDDTLAAINEAEDQESLGRLMSRFAGSVGLRGAYIIAIHPLLGMVSVDDRPAEWVQLYDRQGYIYLDPVAHRIIASEGSFTWDDCFVREHVSDAQRALRGQAGEFGLADGFNSVFHGDKSFIASSCFFSDSTREFRDSMRAHRPALAKVAAAAQERMVGMLLPEVEVPKLAPREVECLTWAAVGKTNGEIGTILSLSANTVNGYLSSAAQKLGVRSKIHAVVKAMRLKIIFPL